MATRRRGNPNIISSEEERARDTEGESVGAATVAATLNRSSNLDHRTQTAAEEQLTSAQIHHAD